MSDAPASHADLSVDAAEVAHFAALAEDWWDPSGPLGPLHRLNPTRIGFIRDRISAALGRDPLGERPLGGLTVLDVGCGGGLASEPLTRLGAAVTGIDAAAENIAVAAAHAAELGLAIDYRHATAEALAAEGKTYDAVVSLEVVEHVAHLDAFLDAACALVRPGGSIVLATLNRTPKSYALAILGAEYLLRWLEPGTHDWHKFVRPAELARALRRGDVTLVEATGVRYRPLAGDWALTGDLSVNYMVMGVKGTA